MNLENQEGPNSGIRLRFKKKSYYKTPLYQKKEQRTKRFQFDLESPVGLIEDFERKIHVT